MSNRGRGRGQRGGVPGQSSLPSHPRGNYGGGPRGGQSFAGRGRGNPSAPITLFQSVSDDPPCMKHADPGRPPYRAVEDTTVRQREDVLLAQVSKNRTSPELPPRPSYGKNGDSLLVWTNYFHLKVSDVSLFRYGVVINSGGKSVPKALAKRVIELVIQQLKSLRIDAVTDFRSTILCRQDLQDNLDFDVVYKAEGQLEAEDDAPHYRVVMSPTGVLNLSELLNYTTSSSAGAVLNSRQELLQALNIILGYGSATDPNTVTIGRNRRASTMQNQTRISLHGGLEALRAFVFSARAATERVLVNVQVKNLPFLTAVPLPDLASAFWKAGGSPNSFSPFVRLVSVEVTHLYRRGKDGSRIPRFKTVFGLARKRDGKDLTHPPRVKGDGAGPKEVEFWLEDTGTAAGSSKKGKGANQPEAAKSGAYISVYDFFRTRHGITIKDPKLPVVNVGTPANPSYLPMEVCHVRPGQAAKGKLSPKQTADMIKFAVRQPSANAESITQVGLSLLQLERNDLSAFDLKLRPELLIVPARRLPAPQVDYAQGTLTVSNARWDLRNQKLLVGANMPNWKCIYITTGNPLWTNPADLQACLQSFAVALQRVGVRCASPLPPDLLRIGTGDPSVAVSQKMREIARLNPRPSIVLVIMPSSNNTGIYNAVKYACDVETGLLSQCVVDSKFAKSQVQYFVNVGLKINLKLGGSNHSIPASTFGAISPERTMFVGLDVTHPSPGSTASAPSVAGIVASIDRNLAQWPAAIRIQESKKEMVTDLGELFQSRLKLWQSKNRSLPSNVVFYRDGVSEGQYATVLDEELPEIKKAARAMYSPAETKQGLPKVAIIIVGKRHHTRFYPTREDDADPKTGNLRNGLVVDRGITSAYSWDFFLQAHNALHGTARPAHNCVIYDELFRSTFAAKGQAAADALEKMIHGLCYLFGRATSAVSICPPAYYADLVCERARCYLSEKFAPDSASESSGGGAGSAARQIALHSAIENKMFYI